MPRQEEISGAATAEANYTDRHEALRGLFATAELLVSGPKKTMRSLAIVHILMMAESR